MMLYFKTLTHTGFPLISLNRYSDLEDVESFLKSADARSAGKRYLDQMMVLSDDMSVVKDIQFKVSFRFSTDELMLTSLVVRDCSIIPRSEKT